MRCQACRRLLTNPISIRHGLGPDCLKRAALAGTAPMEALGELAEWQRNRPKRSKSLPAQPIDTITGDLFASLRADAIAALRRAAADCLAAGVLVEINIKDFEA